MKKEIARYFDYAATSPMPDPVMEKTFSYYAGRFANAGSLHTLGLEAREALEKARETLAGGIGARPREVIFTGSGTEANNLAILGGARRMKRMGKGNHLITTKIEHPSVLKAFQALETEGFEVTYLPVDRNALVDTEDVEKALRPDTVLVSVMMVNNVVGSIQPIREIGQLLKGRGILFHSDAAQAFGKIPIQVNSLHVDLLTLNGHKIGSVQGIGALYLRNGVRIDPLYFGGEQERGIRPATENVVGILSFAAAWEWARGKMEEERKRMEGLRRLFLQEIRRRIPGARLNGSPDHTLPSLMNIAVERIEGQALMLDLDQKGFATSSASACSAHSMEPSYVLLAMNPSTERALEGLRISMGWGTTEKSILDLVAALETSVKHWRGIP